MPPRGRWEPSTLYGLLSDPSAVEWRERVGVGGRTDGSGKSSTRLLAVQGWVLKTRIDDVSASKEALCERIIGSRARGLAAALWHPDKQWALLRGTDGWHVLSVCPELRTLRQLVDVGARMQAWSDALVMAVRVDARHGLGLDLNPANFGLEPPGRQLYYIDDEFYAGLTERQLAGAMVARIPEETEIDCAGWQRWAAALAPRLRAAELGAGFWERLCEEMQWYPVAEQFEERRAALVAAFRAPLVEAARHRRLVRKSPEHCLTCVFGDVHANLPALEAVLAAARSLGADSYVFVGDAIGYGPHPGECIERIAELEDAVLIRGNHDHAIATGRLDVGMNRLARACAEWTISILPHAAVEWLLSLAVEHITEEWMAVHGAPRDPQRFLAYIYDLTYEENLRHLGELRVPLCFYGHTHIPLVHADLARGPTKLRGMDSFELTGAGPVLVNPGSVGQPRDGDPRAAFALWDRKGRRVRFERVHYPIEKTLDDVKARGLPPELAARLAKGI